jgi:hypothetical protein
MLDRKSLVCTLWLTFALALLSSAPVELIGTSGLVNFSSLPDFRSSHVAIPPVQQPTARLSAGMTDDAASEVNALPSENEEQDRADAMDEPRVSFLIPWSFRKVPDRQSIAPRSILSLYPLRC